MQNMQQNRRLIVVFISDICGILQHWTKPDFEKGGCIGSSESTLIKCHIVVNHMTRGSYNK